MINHRKLISCPTVLASCLVGIIITPYLYIGIGALSNFSTTFSLMMLTPFLAATGFLFWLYLIKQKKQKESIMMPVNETVSWLIVIAFNFFISKFTLFSVIERAGLFSTFFLLASVLCLPFMASRNTLIEQRIKGLHKGTVMMSLILILVSSGVSVVAYQLSPSKFI